MVGVHGYSMGPLPPNGLCMVSIVSKASKPLLALVNCFHGASMDTYYGLIT